MLNLSDVLQTLFYTGNETEFVLRCSSLQLLQRLLDDRRGTVEMIRAEGERIAATAETQDREKIQRQLRSLGEQWADLLEKANAR